MIDIGFKLFSGISPPGNKQKKTVDDEKREKTSTYQLMSALDSCRDMIQQVSQSIWNEEHGFTNKGPRPWDSKTRLEDAIKTLENIERLVDAMISETDIILASKPALRIQIDAMFKEHEAIIRQAIATLKTALPLVEKEGFDIAKVSPYTKVLNDTVSELGKLSNAAELALREIR